MQATAHSSSTPAAISPGDLVSIPTSPTRRLYLVIDSWITFGELRCTIITPGGPRNVWADDLLRLEAA
jgi:hypothetical protein